MQKLKILRRVTSQQYLPEVDGLRFLAIMPVVLMHFRTSFLRFNGRYDLESLPENTSRGSLLDLADYVVERRQ